MGGVIMIDEMGGDFFQWLRGFFYVAKRGSVTLAAMEMGRNQPTVSHQIKCLENEFGIMLFDRSGGRMELTPEGRLMLEKAISIFEIIKEMREETGGDLLQRSGEVSICTTHAVIHYFLPSYVVNFRKQYRDVHFELRGGGVDMIMQKVESAEADFGIASLNTVPDNFAYYELFETRPMLIAPKGSGFFKKAAPSLEEISKAPFIIFPESSTVTPLIKETFKSNNLEMNILFMLNNYETVKEFVALGTGVSILDEYALNGKDDEKMDVYPLDSFFKPRKYGLLMRKRKYLSPCVKAFLRFLRPEIVL